MKKKLAIALAFTLVIGAFAGCTKKEDPTTNPPEVENPSDGETEKPEEPPVTEVPVEDLDVVEGSYFERTSSYFNLSKTEQAYDDDTEFYMTFNKISADDNGTMFVINYQGITGDRQKFEVDYTVADDMVVEQVYMKAEDTSSMATDRFNSIIPGFIVLDGDIEVDNAWSQDFEYNGETYTAETTILQAQDGKFITETVVRGISLFADDTYVEHRTYELGKGLTAFDRSGFMEEESKEAPLFSYTLH